jgi:hypothetical protein
MFQDMQRDKSTAAMRPNHRVQFNLKAKSPENPLLTDDRDYKQKELRSWVVLIGILLVSVEDEFSGTG